MQLSVHLRSSTDNDAASQLTRGAGVRSRAEESRASTRSAARTTSRASTRSLVRELTRNPTPMPLGSPWLASPVMASRNIKDPDAGRALAACLYETLSQELKGIEELGAEVKDLSVGLTVFPSFLDGSTEVLLSWTVSEPEIRTFYPPHSGYRHRKLVEGREFTAVRTPAGQLRE
jgi:hypothetical protein